MFLVAANNAQTTLSGPISSGALTINVAGGTGASFPQPTSGQYFTATLTDAATGLIHEIVWVTAVSGDSFTVQRAKEGTTALAWQANDIIGNWWTAGSMEIMVQAAQLQVQATNYAVDTGSVNNIQITLNPQPISLASIAGTPIRVLVAYTNTGNTTLTITGLAATVVFAQSTNSTTTLAATQILGGQIYEFIYVPSVGFEVATARALLTTTNAWLVEQLMANGQSWGGYNAAGNTALPLIGVDSSNNSTLWAGPSGSTAWRVVNSANNANLIYTGSGGNFHALAGITADSGGLFAATQATGANVPSQAPLMSDFPFQVANPGGNGNYLSQQIPSLLQNGMILQTYGGTNSTGIDSVFFPNAFPHNCIHVLVQEANPQGWFGSGVAPTILSAAAIGATGFTLYVVVWAPGSGIWQEKGGVAYQYIAIGY